MANTTADIVIPLVTVSGTATDSNGRPVPNVTIKQTYNYVYPGTGYYYVTNENSSYPIKSDAFGKFSLTLIAGTGYSETITPPAGSGFAPTVLTGIDATRSFSQSIILNLPDTTPPQILSGPTVSSFTDTTATIEWQTNEPSKGSVAYGTVDPPGTTVAEQSFVSSHSMQLTGLSPNTKYYVKVTASDAAGNGPTASQVVSLTTAPRPDTTPPTVTAGPTVSSITQGTAVIEWTTDEPTTGSVIYGLSTLPDTTVGDSTLTGSHRVTVSGLAADTVYYVKVTATDAANNGPVSTSVVSFRTLTAPDTTAPVVVEGPMAISISDSSATIVWKTDEPATSGVSYDDGVAYGVLSDGALTTSHSMTITGLGASKTYNFVVSSKDASGNGPALSGTKSFSTKATPDTNAPVFTQLPIVKATTHQSVVLYWETDEPASSTIQYGTSEALEMTDAKSELNTKHNRALTGLLPGTTYYFSVQATDAQKNSATGKVYSFTTDLNPDTKAPVITEAANIIYSTDNAATVAFKTDKPCDTVVDYGPNGSNALQRSNSEKVTEHQVPLSNLTPNTSYNVQVSCTDISGNKVVASAGAPSTLLAMNYSFMLSDAFVGAAGGVGFITKSQPDRTAPVITSAPRTIVTTSTMARIQWVTDEIADSQVYYGLTGQSLTSSAGDIVKSAGHSVALTNLKPGTTYDFKVQSTDPSNNTVVSAVFSFTTAALADTMAPVISAVSAAGATTTEIDVAWNTDEQATTVLKYGTTPFTMTGQASITGSRTNHTVSLYNLVPGTTYYVAPVSSDSSGNSVQGATQSVTLLGTAPVSYTVTATAGAGGAITPASQSVVSGYQLALAVKPNTGYMIQSVTGCGGTLSGSVYTTAEITGNCTVSAFFKSDGTLPPDLATTAMPPAGSYSGGSLMVKLSANRTGTTIYYTTDGTTPGVSSATYSGPVTITGNTTLKFFGKDGTSTEGVHSAAYVVTATGQPGGSFTGIKQGTSFTVSRSEGGKTATALSTGSQTSFVDTGFLKPNTIYTYTVSSDVEGATELLSIRTPLYTGWNIIAVPYDTTGVNPGTLFGSAVSAVYQWVPTGATAESSSSVLGSYKTVTSLLPGYGYFVKTAGTGTTFNFKGATSPASATVTLKPGWTMVANPTPDNMSNIASSWLVDGSPLANAIQANKIGGGIYWWNGTTYESWSIVNGNPQVEPWKAYWILNIDSVNHTLSINAK
ncbi:fibronectin type III domain-containing protein [Geomonas subterranea]|uniref:fibronectin type III domain-containing protein n=1 Tax=Geomonas subterranea TaxID=2847989 RepID=UPI001C445732|nr:fibronectin type III domain-containing protein [Geomonas subterranea]QXM09169.1 fibronectin type III domain-containing protein [Geomonas subterranea]